MNSKYNKVIKVISPAATLKGMEVGEKKTIKSRYIKENIIRATASRLNRSGYLFCTRQCDGGIEVTRNK